METLKAGKFRFGNFEMDCPRRSLTLSGKPLSLSSKTFDLLQHLVENHGSVVTKEELLTHVWPDQFVEENNLTVQISAIRKVFGEHTFITTIPGRGYSFVEKVERVDDVKPVATNGQGSLQIALPGNITDGEPIFGRDHEIAEITGLMHTDIRLLILTGAGGSGKTCLARAVAAELSADFTDGVFFVELAAINNAELVVSAIAQTLDIKESTENLPIESLKSYLSERRILLILDNFEQLVTAAPVVKEILTATSSLKIIITSRVALRLTDERECAVLPLSVPPKDAELSVEQLSEYASISLFVARAQRSRRNFTLEESNAADIAEICRRLDGLPLAIELAAARVKLLSASSILARLQNSLDLLTGGSSDLPERQRTMRAAIEWSYELLDVEERALCRRLALFAGGFTVETAETFGSRQLADGSKDRSLLDENQKLPFANGKPPTNILDLLASLIDNNLLGSKEQTDGSSRLQMLEVVREFAFEILRNTGELDDLQRIHTQYFLSLAEEAEPFLHGEKGNEWLEKLEGEHDNLRAALSWSLKNEPETAARIAADLNHFWEAHSHFSEGLGWCKAALQVTENTISKSRCKLLQAIAAYLRHRGEFEAARQYQEIALTESRELNDLPLIHKATQGLGGIAVVQKDYASAEIFYVEALALSRQINDKKQIAYTLGSFGDLEMCRGNYSAARILIEECRTLSEPGNNPVNTVTYYNLGAVDYFENLYPDAALKFARSLQVCVEIGFKSMMSCALDGFAALAAVAGNYEQSAKLAGAVDSLRESINYHNEPAEEALRQDYLTKVMAALPANSFVALYAQGKAMNLETTLAMVTHPQFLEGDANEAFDSTETISEVVIENHSFTRITIEEEN